MTLTEGEKIGGALAMGVMLIIVPFLLPTTDFDESISVAFIGNSMMYYNDFPRLMEAVSDGHITQNSCLHGDATLSSLLVTGNGMAYKWNTTNALIGDTNYDEPIYDYGACTVFQLLFGFDEGLDNFDDSNYVSDGSNPCIENEGYLSYLEEASFEEKDVPKWDYIVLNDNTRSPPRFTSRMEALDALDSTYIDWFAKTEAIPIFLHPHAYWSPERDMGGLVDVPTFTSLSYEGYRQYAELVAAGLPESQQPRIAPSGIAFLTVWEEHYGLWKKLINSDFVHATPLGTFLQGCVVYYTLYGRMPAKQFALPVDGMSSLWSRARVMQPPTDPPNPIPTREEAEYLYYVAERVAKYGHRPKCFIEYENGEAAYYDEELGYYLRK